MILTAENITKSFRNGSKELPVLKGINLHVAESEIVTIMGPSGSGKSTLLNILGTLDAADTGVLKINGMDTATLNDTEISELRNSHIGFVFQFHHLLPEFTALENVLIPARISNKGSEINQRALEMFEYMGLVDRMDHYPSQLSGGERSRVAVLRAMINAPSLILTDEPTGNLDQRNADRLLQLFQQICRDFQKTLVITTHDPHVASIGHKRYHLEEGKLEELNQ